MKEDEDPRSAGPGAIDGIAVNPGAAARISIAPRSTDPGSKSPKSIALPRSKRSWALALLAYLLLVGAPLVALVMVVRFGANLSAPPSVFGSWTITETTVTKASSQTCVPLSPGEKLSIEQSGRYLRVGSTNGSLETGNAVLEGKQIVGQLRSTRKGCLAAAYRLDAQLAALATGAVTTNNAEASASNASGANVNPESNPAQSPSGKTEGLIARLESMGCNDCATLTFRAERRDVAR
ncbi:MAG TPA: hypothetical protein VFQ61_20320 [Polyangiaceae bacterium]|nr:hypothetical protein [Polyangiaceae bacterium]